jgi:hypothetical protein
MTSSASDEKAMVLEAAFELLRLLMLGTQSDQLMRIYALTDIVIANNAADLMALASRITDVGHNPTPVFRPIGARASQSAER